MATPAGHEHVRATAAARSRPVLWATLALTLAGMLLFVIANVNPIMILKLEGQAQSTTLIEGVKVLYNQGMWELALVVLFTSILVPLAELCALSYFLSRAGKSAGFRDLPQTSTGVKMEINDQARKQEQ